MGCDTNVACKTCKIEYYCGYGSYKSDSIKQLAKRFPAQDHEGHDVTEPYSTDWTHKANGNLYWDGGGYVEDALFIQDYDKYEFITFDPSHKATEINKNCIDNINEFELDHELDMRILQGDFSLNQEIKKKYSSFFGKWRTE